METKQRKVGRPKAPPRTGPLVLGDDGARTKVTLEISERAAQQLAEYVHWVEQCSGMAEGEARFKTIDFALLATFRRDREWQAKRRSSAGTTMAVSTPPPPASARTPSVAPPSLPPPVPREVRPIPDGRP
jgi:hypothetical protein